MNFFTRDLLERYGWSDPDVARAAEAEWEKAVSHYDTRWQSIRAHVPPSVVRLQEDFYLHDAAVRSLGRQGNHFVIVLQLAPPPHDLLTLHYTLTEEPEIDREALAKADRTPPSHVEWMYDEVELERAETPVLRHAILLSNGREVRLRFRALEVSQAEAILPLPGTTPASPSTPVLPQPA